MEYKSPYRVVLKLIERELNGKRKELAKLAEEKNEILAKMEKERQKMTTSYERMSKGSIQASFVMSGYDHEFMLEMKKKLQDREDEIQEIFSEYRKIKKKKEAILEMDNKKEKEFNKWKHKKEQKNIDALRIISKIRKDGGD